jgi:hypothetical protein
MYVIANSNLYFGFKINIGYLNHDNYVRFQKPVV